MNEEEELLGFPRSQFAQLEEAPKVLAPYLALWTTAQDFQKKSYMWLNGPMLELDPEVLEKEVKDMWKNNLCALRDPNLCYPNPRRRRRLAGWRRRFVRPRSGCASLSPFSATRPPLRSRYDTL